MKKLNKATLRAVALAMSVVASASANAGSVVVGVDVSGVSGSWSANFTFSNQLESNVSLYLFGVKADGYASLPPDPFWRAAAPTYNTASAGGADIVYNNVWLDLSLSGLTKGATVSGFNVLINTVDKPKSFQWFAMTRGGSVIDSFNFGSPTTAGFQGTVNVASAVPESDAAVLFLAGVGAVIFRRKSCKPSSPTKQ